MRTTPESITKQQSPIVPAPKMQLPAANSTGTARWARTAASSVERRSNGAGRLVRGDCGIPAPRFPSDTYEPYPGPQPHNSQLTSHDAYLSTTANPASACPMPHPCRQQIARAQRLTLKDIERLDP